MSDFLQNYFALSFRLPCYISIYQGAKSDLASITITTGLLKQDWKCFSDLRPQLKIEGFKCYVPSSKHFKWICLRKNAEKYNSVLSNKCNAQQWIFTAPNHKQFSVLTTILKYSANLLIWLFTYLVTRDLPSSTTITSRTVITKLPVKNKVRQTRFVILEQSTYQVYYI